MQHHCMYTRFLYMVHMWYVIKKVLNNVRCCEFFAWAYLAKNEIAFLRMFRRVWSPASLVIFDTKYDLFPDSYVESQGFVGRNGLPLRDPGCVDWTSTFTIGQDNQRVWVIEKYCSVDGMGATRAAKTLFSSTAVPVICQIDGKEHGKILCKEWMGFRTHATTL